MLLLQYYLMAWLAVVLGINSTHNAVNLTRRSQVKLFLVLLVLLISNTTAYHAIIYNIYIYFSYKLFRSMGFLKFIFVSLLSVPSSPSLFNNFLVIPSLYSLCTLKHTTRPN